MQCMQEEPVRSKAENCLYKKLSLKSVSLSGLAQKISACGQYIAYIIFKNKLSYFSEYIFQCIAKVFYLMQYNSNLSMNVK